MTTTYYNVLTLASAPGETVVTTNPADYDRVYFTEPFVTGFVPTTVTRIDMGAARPEGLSTVITFTGSDGLARTFVAVGTVEHLSGTNGIDQIVGNAADNWINGDSPFLIVGGNDVLHGGDGNDLLFGYAGRDKLYGDAGDDYLVGGALGDTLNGGGGKDTVVGDDGADVMTGGFGADAFRFELPKYTSVRAMDRITDFSSAEGDKIDLHLMDADTHKRKVVHFHLVDAFTGNGGELHVSATTGGVVVEGEVNHDTTADFAIFVAGVTSLSATDFLL